MKRIALTVALIGCAAAAFAQTADIPAPNCGAKPEYPGRLAMTSDLRRRAFDREIKAYTECIKAYVEERRKTADANTAAGNAAIEEYNAQIKKVKDDETAAQGK
jgi:hypothetical protein